MSSVEEEFAKNISRFDRKAAFGFSAIYQFFIADGVDYYLVIDAQDCGYKEGIHDHADIAMSMNHETLISVLDGSLDGMQAFMFGQVKVDGDLHLAKKLLDLFPR